MAKSTRITLNIDAELLDGLDKWTREVGISKEALLGRTLGDELDYLDELSANEEAARRLVQIASQTKSDRRRLNITLERSVATRLSELCETKGIPRDRFVACYIDFLVNGDPEGNCPSPLMKAADLLSNPRTDYSRMAGHNPYDDLHFAEEDVEQLLNLLMKRAGT